MGMKGKRAGLLICSRQIGKTVASVAELIDRTLRGPANTANAYLCPAQTQARRIAWPEIKRQLSGASEYCKISETQLTITLPGDRVIYCLGAESGENLRGLSIRVMVADERDSISDELWRTVVLPMFSEYGDDAFILSVGTLAGGDSRLWKLYQQHRDDPDWYCAVVTAENSGCFDKLWLDKQRQAMGRSAYLREMCCDPMAPVENAVLGEEVADAEREGRVTSIPYRPGAEVMIAADLGIRDHTAIWGWMFFGRTVEVLFFREYQGDSTIAIIGKLLQEFPNYRFGEAILPHDAGAREKSTGFTVVDAFYDRWPGYIHAFKSAPNPVSTLQAARMNMSRCYFDRTNCEQGLLRLKSAAYVVDAKSGSCTDRIKHDDNSHCIDAFRYGMWRVETMHGSQAPGSFTERWNPQVIGTLG